MARREDDLTEDAGADDWSKDDESADRIDRSDRTAPTEITPSETARNRIQDTDITSCDVAGRVGNIHVLGVLHGHPLTIARVTGAITRYDPDVLAFEACQEAIDLHNPNAMALQWPPRDEVEVAAHATGQRDTLRIAGIDTVDWESTADFLQFDREIFTELDIIPAENQLSRASYYTLDLPTIRQWRNRTQQRDPAAFTEMFLVRDEVMAGHLHALKQAAEFETVVAAVGIQHLTGVLDRLADPSRIPAQRIERPPIASYDTT